MIKLINTAKEIFGQCSHPITRYINFFHATLLIHHTRAKILRVVVFSTIFATPVLELTECMYLECLKSIRFYCMHMYFHRVCCTPA